MPISSQMHTPQLIGEDDSYIRYGFPADEFGEDCQESKTADGVVIRMGKYKADGKPGVMECRFPKSQFDSAKAAEWISAQKFSVQPAELYEVKGVEIFATGLWNGKQITDKDLETIVDSFNKTQGTVRPFLKLGHDEDQKLLQSEGLPAAGWVENVRKVGSKLVADFADIPKKVFQLITNKAYRKVSCEIYNNIDIAGEKFQKLLGAVALLGAETPGVMNLSDILSMYSAPMALGGVQKFAEQSKADIITTDLMEDSMAELDEYKAKLELAEKEEASLKSKLAAQEAETEKYKKVAEEAQAKVLEEAKKVKAAKVEAFMAEVKAEGICPKAAESYVKALVEDEKETYSIEDKKDLSKSDLVKAVLKFASEAGKVNTDETTTEGGAVKVDSNLVEKVEKYAKDNGLSFGKAYRIVTKDMDLAAKPL